MIYFRLFIPYLAVGVFWTVFKNAWLTIACYHILILVLSKRNIPRQKEHFSSAYWLFIVPTVLTGAVAYFLLPLISKMELSEWLVQYRLSGLSFILMIPYFSLIHPFLEEIHWVDLRDKSFWSHISFAGYHVVVLEELLYGWALLLCFVVLVGSSIFWKFLAMRSKSLLPSSVSHLFADAGIIVAAYLLK